MELRHREYDEALKAPFGAFWPLVHVGTMKGSCSMFMRCCVQVARQASGQKKAAALKEDKAHLTPASMLLLQNVFRKVLVTID